MACDVDEPRADASAPSGYLAAGDEHGDLGRRERVIAALEQNPWPPEFGWKDWQSDIAWLILAIPSGGHNG